MDRKYDVTAQAKEIFGEIVVYAYMLRPKWWDYEEDEERLQSGKLITATNKSIEPYDALPIFVKFNNGKTFEIWSSEYGGIDVISEEDYLEKMGF